ncbi:MAG: PAS domain S-box protein [Pelatocladus maniniholoensis HA4357-MV3]|jgi:PAS domain S-box-containing protein|uniref:histidine kinase n=1 Tax=Pelatocladus maniniholoensis HA4357-MV3 TaxID=1117104 RepID=A0A9E3LU23_9NOST|nr:PAS domain S-box protein [Pelatocladus maniniholoensis HA4357-MV3]
MIIFLSHLIVEAEKARVLGQVIAAEEYYEQAIDTAKANDSLEEEAFAYELAAQYYLERGRLRFARNYMKEAHYAYTRLNATAKVKELETKYPQLLLGLSVNSNNYTHSTSPKLSSSSSEEALELLEAVIRANLAISSEIELERLLKVLMKILIENADAQTGYLILPSPKTLENGEEWQILASGTVDTEASEDALGKPVIKISVQSLPIDYYIPISVINDVIHTLKNVVVDDASWEGKFIHDPYIRQHQTKSILCAPLLNQGQLVGIVYLENNLTNGVFTNKRLDVLKLLFAQAAISISHAKIYSQLRESEKQLRAKERRVNQILDAIPIAVTAHDPTGRFIYNNLKAQQLLGIKIPLEIKTEQLPEVFQAYQAGTDQLYPIDKLPLVRTFAGESVKIDDMELRQADQTIPLEVLTVPIFDETSAIIYAIAAFRDITEHKQSEKLLAEYNQTLETQIAERTEKLQQQNEILQALFDHIPVMLKLRDQADQTLVINREYERVLGWTLDELRDVDWLAKCYPDTKQRQQTREHIQAATGKWLDFRTRCRNGRYVDTTWANIRLSTGQIIGIGQDISDRKQLEKALQASQAKLNDILNSAGASITSFRVYPDCTWENEYHSLGCETVFGYTPQELTSELWLSRVPSEDLAAITKQAFAAIAQEQATTVEYRFYHKNCSLRWIAHTLTSRWDQAGDCWIVTMVGVDITARKLAETALRESEERFREIAENINQIFFVWSADSEQFLYISPGYEKIYGLSCESLYQNPKSWLNAIHPDDRKSVWQSLNEQSQGKSAWREYRIIKSDGTIRWMFAEVFPIFDPDGNLLRYIGLTEDITERKRAEQALRESELFLRSIYEGTAAAIFIVDVQEDGGFRYVDINPAHEWMSGLFSSEMAGKTPEQVFPPEDAQVMSARFQACTTTGKRITYEERLVIRDKETWWINVLTPIYRENGQIYRLIGSCFNITRRKKLEQSLRSQADHESLLATITQHIRQSLDLEQILATTVVEVQKTLQADRVLIFRLNQDGSGEIIKEAVLPEYLITNQMRWTDECFPNDCYDYYRQGNPRILPDVAKDEWAECLVEFMEQVGVKSKVVAPIVQTLEDSSTRVWGLLIVHACSDYRQWRASEAEFLQQISNQLAIALHQANLYHQLQIELAERKQTEKALRQNQVHLAMAQKVSQIGSWEFDLNSQKISCSQTTFHHWGIEPVKGEPSFAQLLERVHPEDREVLQQYVEQAITKGITYTFDLRIVWPDGSIRYLDSRAEPVFNTQGQVIQLIGTSLDITKRKQTEDFLRESEERFRKAFDAAPIGVALVSPQGKFLMVNRSLCEIVGYTEAEMLNLTMIEITHPDDLEADLELMQKLLANEIRVFQVEKRYLHNRGDTIHTLLNVSLVKDQHRQPLYFIAQIQDISDRYEVDRIKNEFISIVSHELRTPLTAIRGSVGILETGVFDNEPKQAKEMLQIAFNNSDRLVRLVNDILDLERLESGKIQLVMETCEIANLVQQAIETVQAIANEAEIKLSVMVPNMQISAAADSIIQTLINLLSNAIKFSPVGGTVWLSAELMSPEEDAGMRRSGGSGGNGEQIAPVSPLSPLPSKILFKVRDQGRGIPPEKLESIFGRFQQVDVSDRRQKRGTGLGLAICKNIVQQHGGHIWVESVLGEGSTFYFTLPIMKEEDCQLA